MPDYLLVSHLKWQLCSVSNIAIYCVVQLAMYYKHPKAYTILSYTYTHTHTHITQTCVMCLDTRSQNIH